MQRLRTWLRFFLTVQLLPALEGGEETLVGGQAVLEGVMMRSPHAWGIACRKSSGEITTHSETIERHANSTQYLLVLDGPVQTHVLTDDGWRVDRYGYDDATRLESRWHVVPPGVWHRTVAPGAHEWCVVAFHSAREVSDEYQ